MNVTVGFIKLELKKKKKPLREIPKETASVLFFLHVPQEFHVVCCESQGRDDVGIKNHSFICFY